MLTGKTLRNIFGILTLASGLLLAACGDNTATTAPSPATPPATTAVSAAPTTAPATTAASTPTTAPATTAPVTTAAGTTPGATTATGTTAASGQTGGSKAAELLANIPNSPDYLTFVSYNNYLAFRKANNLPANATFDTLSQDQAAFKRFSDGSRFLNPSQLMAVNYFKLLRGLAGFDMLQADYDVEAGQPPNLISLAQGNFDAAAIDKAWTDAGAVKGTVGPNTSYTIDKLDLSKQLQTIFIGNLALIPVPAQKMLIYGKPPAAAAVASALPSKTPLASNPAVKGLLDVFGDPLSLYMGTALISSAVNIPLDTSPGAAKDALEATIKANKPVPPPLMAGYAFYQDDSGAKTYVVANYYTDPASAQAAAPVLLDRLKNGNSLVARTPYSKYWEVASSEVKGNIVTFKLNWKYANSLSQFVLQRDFPAFLV